MIKILFLGDIVAKPGRRVVNTMVPDLVKKHQIDFVIANGENATHGKGLIYHHYQLLKTAGVDAITLGNHFADRDEIRQYLDAATDIIRPLNLLEDFPGLGSAVFDNGEVRIRVTNLLGEAFLNKAVVNPFVALDQLLQSTEPGEIHIVDFHAEATAEKKALAYAFDGKVSAVIGTHTHTQTRDNQILPHGTAFITDVGMCGPYQSVLGVKPEIIIARMWRGEKQFFDYDEQGQALLSAVVISIDETTALATEITPLYLLEPTQWRNL